MSYGIFLIMRCFFSKLESVFHLSFYKTSIFELYLLFLFNVEFHERSHRFAMA